MGNVTKKKKNHFLKKKKSQIVNDYFEGMFSINYVLSDVFRKNIVLFASRAC